MLLSDIQTIVGIPKRFQRARFRDFYTDQYIRIHSQVDIVKTLVEEGFNSIVFIYGDDQTKNSELGCAILSEWIKHTNDLGYYSTIDTIVEYKKYKDSDDEKLDEPFYGDYNKFLTSNMLLLDNITKKLSSNAAQIYFSGILEEFITYRCNSNKPIVITSKYPLQGAKSVASFLSARLAEIIRNESVLTIELK